MQVNAPSKRRTLVGKHKKGKARAEIFRLRDGVAHRGINPGRGKCFDAYVRAILRLVSHDELNGRKILRVSTKVYRKGSDLTRLVILHT